MHELDTSKTFLIVPYMYNDASWPGGATYIHNFVHIMSSLPESERPHILLLDCLDDPKAEPLATLARTDAVAGVFNRNFIPSALKPWLMAYLTDGGADGGVRKDRLRNLLVAVGATFPTPYPFWSMASGLARPIFWIPDFQHKRLPDLFSAQERADRDRVFGEIAAAGVPLVLSSAAARADYEEFFPNSRTRAEVWSFCSVLSPEAAAQDGDPRIEYALPERYIYVANQFWAHKDHKTAIRALRILRDRGIIIPLVCTGMLNDNRNAGFGAEIEALIAAEGLTDQIHILGVIPRARQLQLFRYAAAIVQPSRFEGWSTVVEDARLFGRPVILSDIAVHQEQMGADAAYFKTGDPADLARALTENWPRLRPGPDPEIEQRAAAANLERRRACARAFLDIVGKQAAAAPAPAPVPAFRRPTYALMSRRVEAICHTRKIEAKEWYPPVMVGVEEIRRRLFSGNYVQRAADLLQRLDGDEYTDYLQDFYGEGLRRFGPEWRYADIVTVLLCLGDLLKPRRYLEIGVRRGRSLCAVASVVPDCALFAFDMWLTSYAGMENPGASFVQGQLRKIGHRGSARFTDGDSHRTLPAFFAEDPTAAFDLITVDGDHSPEGAAQDLRDVLPRLAVGGAVVFDDIAHPAHPELRDVWRDLVGSDPRFAVWNYEDAGYGVGVAIRKSEVP